MVITVDELLKTQDRIHVFGYGSLTWKPDFDYDKEILGYIKGYERRFWQGSSHHRGTPEKPGRVLTLTKVDEGKCWGIVFEVSGSEKIRRALDYLQMREQSLGHYDISIVPVHIKDQQDTVYSIVYYATPKNPLFLGDGPLEKLADNIANSFGKVGHNIEYLFRLADFMREKLPNESEEHLFQLDALVRTKVGLSTKNILPWKKLLEMQTFRNIIFQTEANGEDHETRELSSSPTTIMAYV